MLQEWGEIIALDIALTQAVKRVILALTGKELGDLSIVVSLAIGVGLAIAKAISESAFGSTPEVIKAIFAGITVGLTASGLYSTVKSWAGR